MLKRNERKWTMRDGKNILIKDMETSHIKNCVAMLKRNIDKIRLIVSLELLDSCFFAYKGEMSDAMSDAFDYELCMLDDDDYILNSYLPYKYLTLELKYRERMNGNV